MVMRHGTPRLFAVMRVVDSTICFLDADNSLGELSAHTVVFDSRDECYTEARKVSGLVCAIGYKLADAFGVSHPTWEAQRAADKESHVELDEPVGSDGR